ncbi:S-layer homology domain-containing protein [Lysinibacillus sp. NPDC096418]|uniref:S-layer homology domain-containing protein n=1 Tax=Lysinibacillus sp. NPDC096418 TaxID=3364138 RepID=UPI00380D6DF4
MKKNKCAGLVVIILLLSVIVPDFAPQAAGGTVTKTYTATADTMELNGQAEYNGIYDNYGGGYLYVGMSNNDGFVNVRNRTGVSFNLGAPEGTIVSAELVLTVATVLRVPNHTLYMELRGSVANSLDHSFTGTFPSVDTNSPYADKFTAKSTAEVPMGTYLQDQTITLNVKSAVDAFTDGSDCMITFTLNGNEADADSGRFLLYSLEASNAAFRPKLVVTYATGPVNNPPTGSFTIAEGAATSNSIVNLSVTGSDPDAGDSVTHMRFADSAANLSMASWLPFSNTATFSLSGGDGSKTIYMQLRDSNNGISANSSQTILLDQTAPTGTLTINDGAIWTNSGLVTLKGTYSDGSGSGVEQARLSNTNGTWQTSWFNIADLNGRSWVLPAGEGAKTVYVQYRDKVGNSSSSTISSTITLDSTAPVITNVLNNKEYNSTVTPQFNEGSGLLNGNPYTSGTTITQDGSYTLIVTDPAGNSSTVSFKIDTVSPSVSGVTNGGIYNTNKTITFNEGTATLNGAAFSSGAQVTLDGVFTLVVTDAAGNITTVNFEIDKVAPTVTGVVNNGYYKEAVTITFNEGTATLNGAAFTSGTVVTQDGIYTLVVTNQAGNVTTVNFMIDKTAPSVTGVSDGGVYKNKVTVGFNEGTATLNGTTFYSGTEIDQDGSYMLVVIDMAGNSTTVSFEVDTKAPIITGVSAGKVYKAKVTPIFNEGTATLNGATFISGTEIDQDGDYELVVTDAVGNVTTVNFMIDQTAPSVTGVSDGGVHKNKVTVGFNKGTATLNGKTFVSGTEIDQDGSYTLVVTDAAGNVTKIQFIIDRTPPTGTIVINSGSATTNSKSVTLNLTSSDGGGSGVTEMRFSTDELTWSAWEEVALTKKWDLVGNAGPKKIYVQYRDAAGNSSISNVASIEYKTSNGSDNGGGGYVPTPEPSPTPVAPKPELPAPIEPTPIPIEPTPIPIEPTKPAPMPEEPEKTEEPTPSYRFSDISTNWAKDMIEDIAERGIITGYPDGTFRPNDLIKREHVTVMFARAFELTPKRDAVSFSDVPTSHPYYEAITRLQQAGVIDGSTGAFNPSDSLTRAQLAKILVLAFGLTPGGTSTFQDVPKTHWSYDYIAALADVGIALGDNGNFRPNEPVTRAQFVAFMYRALNL